MKKTHLFAALLCLGEVTSHFVFAQDLVVDGGTTNITSGINFYDYTLVGGATSDNQLNVLNGGTLLTNSGSLTVGQSGSSNSLVISNEGRVANTSGAIGANSSSSNNSVLVTGTNSTWTNSGTLYVGYAGSSNSLVISNGATVANTAGSIGDRFTSSENSVLVTGTGSRWANSENLSVGFSGSSNSLVISNGATVASATGFVGLDSISSNNTVLVTGDGSLWANSSSLTIGITGSSNSLVISNGATVASATGLVGLDSTSWNNSVLVTGDGSLWANSSSLYVGNDGSSNSLVISNGGSVANTFGVIGNASISSNNSVLVTGTNSNGDRSTWTNSADLYVGNLGSGNSLVISNGGTVANSNAVIGNQTVSSNNSVLVTGSNSLWTNSGDLRIGNNGASNRLVISSGGKVVSSNGYIGVDGNGGPSVDSNQVLVTDAGSSWSNSAQLFVGAGPFAGGNSLVVSNGGVVYGGVDLGNGDGVLVGSYASNNSVTVDGSGSRLFVTGGLMVGKGGNGWANENSLTVSGGGQVISLDNIGMTIGFSQSSNNSVLVTGTGSLLSFNNLAVGGNYDGSGTLTVSDGASIVATNTIDISYQSPGALNVGALNGSDTAGTITASRITVGYLSTNGSLNFNQVDSLTLTSHLSGIGTINQFGSGTTILSGTNTGFTGLTTITNGQLQFGDGVTAGGAPVAGNMSNNASLVFSPASTDTYVVRGNISGSGRLTEIGTGTTVLSGNNSDFTGLTRIKQGTLQFGDGVTAGGAPVAGSISNNASLIFAPSSGDTYTVSGNISGSGRFTQIGNGTTVLSGNNTYTGGTVIANGLLATTSTNALGTGFVTVTNTGKLVPGVDDALVIAGDFTFTTGSAFVWQLLGNTNGGAGNFTPAVDLSANNLSVDLGSTFELFFGPSVDASDAFWAPGATNSWTIFTGTSPSLGAGTNFSLDWAAGSVTDGFDLANFSLGTNATGLVLTYNAPRYLWNTNAGDWTNAANWIDNTVPGAANDAYIDNGGLALVNGDAAAANNLYVGYSGSSNSLVISNGATVASGAGFVGLDSTSSNNSVLVTGTNSAWTNTGDLVVGDLGSSNSLVISNGGSVLSENAIIGNYNINNSVTVAGTGSAWTNTSELFVGLYGSSNSLVISNGGAVVNSDGYIGGYIESEARSSNNSVLVTGTSSAWTNTGSLIVGFYGSSNSLVISNGGHVENRHGTIGFDSTSSNNSVLVTGTNSAWTNTSELTVGYQGSSNSLVISNGGSVASLNGRIGIQSSSNNVLVTGTGSAWTNTTELLIGNTGSDNSLVISNGGAVVTGMCLIGDQSTASNNSVLVTGTISAWTNTGDLFVGYYGSSNSLVISNGGTVANRDGFIGFYADSSNNSVLVTGTGSTWTNSGTLVVGVEGTGNTLTVAEGGTIAAANIVIAASNGSSGTLNVGRFGANGAASTITAPTIAFGAGTGVINFNQSNTVTVSSVISGAGMVNQLGTGWTVLSGANTYTGPTTVSAGTLVAQSQTALGTGGVTLLGGTLELQSQLDIGSLLWDGAAVIAMPGVGNGQFLNVTGLLKLTNGVNNFNLAGAALPRSPVKLLSSTNLPSLSTDDFGVLGLGSYTLSIDGNTLYLTAQDISYQSFAITPNQVSVAKALDTFIGAPGDRGTVSAALDTLAISQYPAAFEQLMPSQYASLPSMVFNVANALNSSLFQRMWAVRSSGRGFSSSGMNLAPMQGEMGGTDDMGVFAINPSKETRWGTFVDGNGVFANASSTGSVQNYRSQSGGVSTGAAYSWSEALATGVYVGYQGLQAEYDSGRTIDNAVRFGVFGTYEVEDFYFNALVGGAYHGYTVSRNIDFGGLDRTATGRPGAGEFNLALGTGYDFQAGDLTFGPFTTLQYTYLGVQGFTETGADALDLDVSPYDSSSMLYTLGAQAAYNWKLSKDVIITPVAFAGWQHEFLQNGYTINSSFATGGPAAPFNYNTSSPARDNFYGGAGVTVSLGERWQATFIYSASAANEDNSSQNLYLSAGYKF